MLENFSNLSNHITFLANASATGSSSGTGATPQSSWTGFIPIILLLVLIYLFMFRPQRKKEKEAQKMRDNIQIGDEICTIGGILGMVVKIGDDNVVIETGGDKSKLRIQKWAIRDNITAMEQLEADIKKAKADKANKNPIQVTSGGKDNNDKKSKKSDEE